MWLIEVVVGAVLGLVTLLTPGGVTRRKGFFRELQARNPGSTVVRAELVEGPWVTLPGHRTIEFVVADRRGLRFCNADGAEQLRVEPSGLERVSAPEDEGVQIRVLGGDPLEFWCADPEAFGALSARV